MWKTGEPLRWVTTTGARGDTKGHKGGGKRVRQRSVEPKMVERSLGTPDGMSAGPGNGPMGKKALASQEKKIRSVPEDTPPPHLMVGDVNMHRVPAREAPLVPGGPKRIEREHL